MKQAIAAMLASVGFSPAFAETNNQPRPDILPTYMRHKRKGHFPQGKRCKARDAKKYMPAGEKRNVELPDVRNPKQAADMNRQHDAWFEANRERLEAAQRGDTRRAISLRENEKKNDETAITEHRGFAIV